MFNKLTLIYPTPWISFLLAQWYIFNFWHQPRAYLAFNFYIVVFLFVSKLSLNIPLCNDIWLALIHNYSNTFIMWLNPDWHWTSSKWVGKLGLTAHNWQKWKSTFLTCHCREKYREEAVSLKGSNYTLKLKFLWICEIWGNFGKKLYFDNNCFIKVRI